MTGGIVERKLIVGAQGDHKIGLLSWMKLCANYTNRRQHLENVLQYEDLLKFFMIKKGNSILHEQK